MSRALATPDERIARWKSTGDWWQLWPHYGVGELRSAQRELSSVARALLAAPPVRIALEARNTSPGALGVAAFLSGMGPLLGWWLAQGKLDAPPPVAALLARHLDEGRRRAELLRRELQVILAELHRCGVRPIVLKGLHTGSVYFPEPGTRPSADIDLLVHPQDLEATARALDRLGFREARRTTFAARSEWVRVGASQKVADLEVHSPFNPWHVDLHCSLERWYFRGLRVSLGDEVFDNPAAFEIDGLPANGLNQPYLTALLALHTSYELVRTRMVWLTELAWVMRQDSARGTLDWNLLLDLLHGRGLGRFVYPALELVERFAPGTVDREVLEYAARQAPPRLPRVVNAVEREHFGFLSKRSLDDKLMWARGFRELLLNFSEWIWPSDEAERSNLMSLYGKRLRMLARRQATFRATP